MRGRALEDVLNHLGRTSLRGNEPRSMGIDDGDIDTGASVACVMTLGVVASCVAGGGKELGGDEGGPDRASGRRLAAGGRRSGAS